jgi:hypothetical protein
MPRLRRGTVLRRDLVLMDGQLLVEKGGVLLEGVILSGAPAVLFPTRMFRESGRARSRRTAIVKPL